MKHLDDDPIYELSTRIRNVLIVLDCRLTPGGIAERFVQLTPYEISRIPNLGAHSLLELHRWLVRHLEGYSPASLWQAVYRHKAHIVRSATAAQAQRMDVARAKVNGRKS
jgi:hypothetical protein